MKNIIFLVWDDVRVDRTCISTYERETTPFLRSLMPNSIVFTQAVAHGFWSVPSVFSMFTGKHPRDHNMTMEFTRHGHRNCPNTNKMLTEDLKELGYSTWGYVGCNWFGRGMGFHKGFDLHWEYNPKGRPDMREMVEEIQRSFTPGKGPHDSPFFLYLNPIDAVAPYHTPSRHRKWTPKGRYDEVSTYVDRYFVEGADKAWGERQYRQLRDRYDDAILDLDRVTGQFWRWLQQEGHLDNTIVVIASDHGEYLGEHSLFHHTAALYDTVLRVPLLIWLGPKTQGKTVNGQLETRHLHTLILQAAKGEELRPELLMSEFAITCSPVPTQIITACRKLRANYDHPQLFSAKACVRTKEWKYIVNSRAGCELYDLTKDPEEKHNIFTPSDPRVKVAISKLKEAISPPEEWWESDVKFEKTERICYVLKLSRGSKYVVVGTKTGNRYEFTHDNPCLEVDPRDVDKLLGKVKKVFCYQERQQKEITHQVFKREDK